MESERESLMQKLRPGDHIASERSGNLYEHHGIYVGWKNGYHMVTHFKAPINKLSTISGKEHVAKCTKCNYEPPEEGGRVTSCLDCFCQGQKIYIIKYKVRLPNHSLAEQNNLVHGKILQGYRNKKLYLELYKGSELFGHLKVSTEDISVMDNKDNQVYLSKFLSCRTPEQVIEAVQSNHYSGNYSLLFNNCEDFAVYCMTGKERSIQAENKLHKIGYKVTKTLHLFTDRRKMKEKMKEKALRLFKHSY